MKLPLAVLGVLGLVACGGGDSPTAPSAPAPTPVPVSYSGTYRGTMSFTNSGEEGVLPLQVSLTTSATASSINLGGLSVTSPVSMSFGLGSGTFAPDKTFDILNSYSAPCGTVLARSEGYFSGDGGLMNLRVRLAGTGSCGASDMRGELRR